MAHGAWLATQGIVRAAGGSISAVFRMMIGTTLSMVSMLQPILVAQASTGDYIRAGIGLISLMLAISAMKAAERRQIQVSDALRGANMALHGVQSMIGNLHF